MFMGSSIILLLSVMLQYLITIWLLGINVIEEFFTAARASFAENTDLLERIGGTEEQIEQYNELVGTMLETLEITLPALLILAVFVTVWIHLLINLPVLRRLSIAVPRFPPFEEMKLPKAVLWYYLITLLITLLTDLERGTMVFLAISNAMIILQLL